MKSLAGNNFMVSVPSHASYLCFIISSACTLCIYNY